MQIDNLKFKPKGLVVKISTMITTDKLENTFKRINCALNRSIHCKSGES